MGFLRRILSPLKRSEPKPPSPDDDFWYLFSQAIQMHGGQVVNTTTSQRIAAVYACVTGICESIAMLPATTIEETDERTKRKYKDHYLYRLLHDQPNPSMDSFEWFELMQENALSQGDAYSILDKRKSGAIVGITPVLPEQMTVVPGLDRRLGYRYQQQDGTVKNYDQSEVFHFRPHTRDGVHGRTPVQVAAPVYGFALALQEHGNKLFENGAFLSGLITSPFTFKDDEARKNFMDSFKKFMGSRNTGKWGLLEGGTKYEPFQMKNSDAQFLESKKFSVIDVARLYRMPPHMIQDLEKGASYSSIEQQSINFVVYTIQPWATRWERAVKRQLLNSVGDENVFLKFNLDALIRGELKGRIEAIVQQIQYGLLTVNEARTLEDKNPIPEKEGDLVLVSHNLRPISDVTKPPPASLAPPSEGGKEAPKDQNSAQKEEKTSQEPEETSQKQSDSSQKSQETDQNLRFRPLFNDLMGRIVRRELRAAKTALKKEGFLKWADEFMEEERRVLRETLGPAFIAYGAPISRLGKFEERYFSARADSFIALASNPSAEFRDDTEEWTTKLISSLEETS